MPFYTFQMCRADGYSTCLETREAPHDSAAFPVAGELLNEHASAHHVAVWEDDRPVLSRYRDGPVLRAVTPGQPGVDRPAPS